MFLLVPAYPGCPGSKAVKRLSLLLLLLLLLLQPDCLLITYARLTWLCRVRRFELSQAKSEQLVRT